MDQLISTSMPDANKIDTRYSNETTTTATIFSSTGKLTQSELVEEFIYTKLILAVCVFGIGGNLLNFVILSQKSLTYLMERMEKSAHYGLIALAVSDFFVCLTALPSVFYGTGKRDGGFVHASFDFRLVHKLYGNGVINTFMLSSTWLTVTMAVSRYIAICHPLRARQIIGKKLTVTSLVTVFVVSVLFNVPRFLCDEARSIVDDGGSVRYFAYPGPLTSHPGAKLAYLWVYFCLGIVLPLCMLVFCNAYLIKTLRMSMLSRSCSQSSFHRTNVRQTALHRIVRERSEQAAHRITLTLIVIIVLFVVLFVPSELVNFSVELAAETHNTDAFNVAVTVGNLLQAINFAVNFVLYSVVNTYFRYAVCRMIRCTYCRRPMDSPHHGRRPMSQAVATTGETLRSHNLHASRCADLVGSSRQQLPTRWGASQRTTTLTTAVSFV